MRQRYGWIGFLLLMILWTIPHEKSLGQQNPSFVKTGNSLVTVAGKEPPGVMIGGYPNAPVYAIAVSGNDVYVGGAFTTAGGVTVNHIAKWDGIRWLPLGEGVNDTVFSIAVSGSDMYAAGNFTTTGNQTVNHVAWWDGTAWHPMGQGLNAKVSSLAVLNGEVYAQSGSTVFRWNGSSWQPFDVNPYDWVVAQWFVVAETGIYANDGMLIFRWNGSDWQSLPGLPGIPQDVYSCGYGTMSTAITAKGTHIYADGWVLTGCMSSNFYDNYNVEFYGFVYRWNGYNWSLLWSYLLDYGYPFACGSGAPWYVQGSLNFDNSGNLAFSGSLLTASKRVYGGEPPHFYCTDPSMQSFNIPISDNPWGVSKVFAFDSLGTGVYIGGGFTNYFTSQNIPNTVSSYTGTNNLQLYLLNATGDAPTISFNNTPPETGSLSGTGVDHVSLYYWQVTGSVTFTNGVISVPIADLAGVTDPGKLVWLKRPGDGDPWENIGGIVVNGRLESTIPFTGFSQFAIGSTTQDNPLPVELTAFTGASTNAGVKLNWTTQSETDNAGFVLLRNGQEVASYTNTDVLKGQGTKTGTTNYSYTDTEPELGLTYTYKLRSVDLSGITHDYPQTVSVKVTEAVPGKTYVYELMQNYPNPFNPGTTIRYQMKEAGMAKLAVYDVLGREVVSRVLRANKGWNEYNFNAANMGSGVYFYRLSISGQFDKTLKMLLVK